ncbi:cysteine synthase family protein [Deltaproteobacteria bacterium TL4]
MLEKTIGTRPVDLVGNTPLLRLERIHPQGNLYAKAEWYNPGRSVKDRAARNMLQGAVDSGELTKDKTILDATSGNTGIALAMLGAALGYKVKLCLPANVSQSRRRIITLYGAELVLTDPLKSSDGAIEEARRIHREAPEQYYYANQYGNDNNWKAHVQSTGPEIYEQTRHQITHFVAVMGTSGTFMGTGRYLKSVKPDIQLIEVQPDSPFHGLEGLKHMGSSIVPDFYDPDFADVKMVCRTEDAYQRIKALAHTEGLLVGISSGAALDVAIKVAEANPEGVTVTIFPDNADKYLEERFWETS